MRTSKGEQDLFMESEFACGAADRILWHCDDDDNANTNLLDDLLHMCNATNE